MIDTLLFTVLCIACFGVATALRAAMAGRPSEDDSPCQAEASERLVTLAELVAEFDDMLIRQGVLTDTQVALMRTGIRTRGVVTGMRTTGAARDDFREVELDLMVRRACGGQFPARQTALIPVSSLHKVFPGSVVDVYYRPDDEHTVAVCVSP
ncbi:hypothetical protein [Mycolicibacterium goodii]|uniref:Uncharacterized protein n=1 Tax=Mycolicibacterium goodii TaxID=134601 RepID=A0A0K0X994_MYCGD|nr:hypothetical protein AFA91_20965 [Mycolicibacterium goodii]